MNRLSHMNIIVWDHKLKSLETAEYWYCQWFRQAVGKQRIKRATVRNDSGSWNRSRCLHHFTYQIWKKPLKWLLVSHLWYFWKSIVFIKRLCDHSINSYTTGPSSFCYSHQCTSGQMIYGYKLCILSYIYALSWSKSCSFNCEYWMYLLKHGQQIFLGAALATNCALSHKY